MDLLLSGVTAVTMGELQVTVATSSIRNAYIGITDGKISHLSDKPPSGQAKRTLHRPHWVVMPGLVNAHTHLPMTLLRGYADDLPLQPWLFEHIFPIEAKMRPQDLEVGTLLALAEALAGGVTSVTDMYTPINIVPCVAQVGMKANSARGVLCLNDNWDFEQADGVREMKQVLRDWHGYDNGRIAIDACIHAEYTSPPEAWRDVAAFAKENELRLQVHISETEKEHVECIARRGKTPTQVLAKQGIFDVPVTVGHGVWLTNEDMQILADKQATIAHCPASNMKLASGIARLDAMQNVGLNVALGSDGMASHNAMDMFADMKLAALLQKVNRRDASALPAHECLKMATANGAKSQGREDGQLKIGHDADLVILDFDKPHLTPCFNPMSHLVYATKASDVVMTLVRGKVLYEQGEFATIDMEQVKWQLRNRVLPHLYGN